MKTNRQILLAISLLLIASLACLAAPILQSAIDSPGQTDSAVSDEVPAPPPQSQVVNVSSDLVSQQESFISLYDAISPGVVSIFIETPQGFGEGSGFVFDKEGHIITNYHVVQDVTYMEVAFSNGLKAVAEVVGVDTDSDLAVIKVNVPEGQLVPLPLGDSESLRVGQTVIAIGNPFGLSGSMSTGIVSSLGRTLDSLNESPGGQFFSAGDLIQTDAAINPGNSGGPLLNLNGEVVGVNRAIRTFNFNDSGDTLNSGIGFAVSVNIVKRVAPAIIDGGEYDYPYLGLSSITTLTLADAQQLGLDRTNGVFITQVTINGPADRSGLVEGDMILSVDGREVANFDALISYLFNHTSPGDTVSMLVLRDGQQFDVDLVLGARP
jgi:S1-C subfamily serine protease